MANDPQGYPVQEYTNLQGDVVFQVLSNGTLVFDSGILITSGNGSPNGVIEAPVGSLYIQKDGTPPDVWWQKQTGTGDTGWVLASGGGSTPPGGNDGNVQFNGMGAFNGTDNFNYVEGNGVSLQQLYRGITVSAEQDVTSAINSTIAGIFDASIDNTNPLVMIDVIGASGRATVSNSGNPSTATHCYALEAILQAGAGAVINQFAGLNISTSVVDPAAAITDAYGIHISDFSIITASGESRAIKVDGGISEFHETRLTMESISPDGIIAPISGAALTIIGSTTAVTGFLPIETHSSFQVGMTLYGHSDTGFRGPTINFERSRNTQASPNPPQSGDILGLIEFGGWNTTSYAVSSTISALANETFSSGHGGNDLVFQIAKKASSVLEVFRLTTSTNNDTVLRIASGMPLQFSTDTGFSRLGGGSVGLGNGNQGDTTGNLSLNQVIKYNGETTVAPGLAYLRGATSQRNETGADTNVLTVTPPAAAGVYRVSIVLSVSAATAATLGWTATWTDSNGHAQAPTNLSLITVGVAAPSLTVTAAANGVYHGEAIIDTNNGAVNIVVKTTFSGTSIAYKASATIERLQ